MKKKLCLLMLMLLTGAQTVLHCADAEDGQGRDDFDLRFDGDQFTLNLNGDQIDETELPGVGLYPLALGVGCGCAVGWGAMYLVANTNYADCCVDLLKRFSIIKIIP